MRIEPELPTRRLRQGGCFWKSKSIVLCFTIIVVIATAGCSKSSKARTAPGSSVGLPGYSRPGDPSLPTDDAKAIDRARTHLETTYGRPVDAYFRVQQDQDKYSVHVIYVTAYDDDNKPVFVPGGHCTVLISNEWKVLEVLPGA